MSRKNQSPGAWCLVLCSMKRKPSSDSKEDTNAHTTAYTQLCSAVLPGQVVHASPTSSARRVISVHSVIIVSCDYYDGDSHDDDDEDDDEDDDDDDDGDDDDDDDDD